MLYYELAETQVNTNMKGGKELFDKRKFKAQMVLAGVSSKELAEKLGINESTLYRKINSNGNFTRTEINNIILLLSIDDPKDIFFADELAETQETN